MNALRRYAWAVFGVACAHLVFGAIVRISGSGMGCGPHWPKCYGHWFPPMSRPDLVIEVTHRYLASILLLSLIGLVIAAWRRRGEPGVGGPGGVLRMASLATALGFGAALLGAVTVKLGNSAPATVAHWTVAMSLVAAVTASLIRAGGLGGASARRGGTSAKTRRATLVAAALALAAVVMGGLTAKVQGGPVACLSFPLCGANPDVARGAVHVQTTHRVIAVLLVLHLIGLFFALRKRQEAPVVRRAASIALGLGLLQLLVAGAMIGLRLPPVLRSLHEATGVSIWIATVALYCLARHASDDGPSARAGRRELVTPEAPVDPELTMPTAVYQVRADVPVARASAVPSGAAPVRAQLDDAPVSIVSPGMLPSRVVALAPAPVAMTYQPPVRQMAEVVGHDPAVHAASRVVAPRVVVAPLELPEAVSRAHRILTASALDFFGIASRAATEAAALELVEREVAIAALAVDQSAAVGAMDAVAVASAIVDAVEAVATVAVEVDAVDAVAVDAVAIDAVAVDALDTSAVDATPGSLPTLATAADAADAAAIPTLDDSAIEALIGARGAPPTDEVGIDSADDHHQFAARTTIFDEPELADVPDAVDELYNLRDFDFDLDADVDDDDTEQSRAEHVPTLDEEFSRQATESAELALGAVTPPPGVTVAALPHAPHASTLLGALSALRRPTMMHSVAVIIARGGDL